MTFDGLLLAELAAGNVRDQCEPGTREYLSASVDAWRAAVAVEEARDPVDADVLVLCRNQLRVRVEQLAERLGGET